MNGVPLASSAVCFSQLILPQTLPSRTPVSAHCRVCCVRVNSFCPRAPSSLRHRRARPNARKNSPAPEWAYTRRSSQPVCHSTCHSSHAHSDASAKAPLSERSVAARLAKIATEFQHDVRAATAGAVLLALAAALYLLRAAAVVVRIPLAGCLTLTALPAFVDSVARVVRSRGRTLDVDVLMSLAAAICVGTGAVFEGALLTTLYAVSHAAEEFVSRKARAALDDLRDVTPNEALRLSSPDATGTPTAVPITNVRIGDFILVRSGEIIPCDGVVASGQAFVSMQHITGESNPRSVTRGEAVPAGARTEDAPLVVKVTEIGAESSLARIARLVTAAQENRPRVTKFFDRFGQRYTRAVLVMSFFIATALPVITMWLSPMVPLVAYAGHSGSMARGLGFLVAASPCALLIGGPVAYLAALSSCARKGVLAKSGAMSLEAASRASHVVFDKTGTLTTGKLTLTSAAILPCDHEFRGGQSNGVAVGDGVPHNGLPTQLDSLKEPSQSHMSRVISAAAALERGAVHPIATAVLARASQLGGELPHVSEVHVIAGQGVEGIVSYDNIDGDLEMAHSRLGRPSYILDEKVVKAMSGLTEEASMRGETVTIFEMGEERYLLRLRDDIREESRQVVQGLAEQGYKVSVLTGDANGAARLVGNAVGAGATVVSNATPKDKLDYVTKLGKELAANNSGVLMIGDGINDAAALAASLVGVACGLSSATAVHAADVVLVREDLSNVGWFLKKARETEAIVRQNLYIALGLMLLATGACIGGAVPLWLAVTLHEGGTLLVGINGLRLLKDR